MSEHGHSAEDIASRLLQREEPSYVGDFVLGAIDGCVTTFALVAGVAGAGLSASVALVLGVASLVADGFSMAVSNYQKAKTDNEFAQKIEAQEHRHIQQFPDGEVEEVRQIFQAKGFAGELLENVVSKITGDHALWVRTMMTEEYGIASARPCPWRTGLITFVAFVCVGLVPLLPFALFLSVAPLQLFAWSGGCTGLAFFSVGALKGALMHKSLWRSGIETLAAGSLAAAIAYGIGSWMAGFA